MGANKYIPELWRQKQSGVMRFLPAVRCWPDAPSAQHRAPHPEEARGLGSRAKQGSVTCRGRVCHGARKRPVPKGATFGKPVHHSVNRSGLLEAFSRLRRGAPDATLGPWGPEFLLGW